MTDLQEKAMRMALERLESHEYWMDERAIQALRQALAPPVKSYCGGKPNYCTEPKDWVKQEPVGWADRFEFDKEGHDFWCNRQKPASGGVPLYTAPPHHASDVKKREWVGLSNVDKVNIRGMWVLHGRFEECLEAIEAKLKEKNT